MAEPNPRPVAPAEVVQDPSTVLDTIAHKEPGMLDKARDSMKPYLDKAQAASKPYLDAAKPYTDAAIAKGHQLVDKLDAAAGVPPAGTAAPAPGTTGAKSPDAVETVTGAERVNEADLGAQASTTTAGLGARAQAAGVPATATEAGEKAKGMFGQLSSTVTSTFNSVTHNLNEKTASSTHPGGFLQQVSQFAEKSLDKVDSYLNPHDPAAGKPVQTTTNSVPHGDAPVAGSGAGATTATEATPTAVPATGGTTAPSAPAATSATTTTATTGAGAAPVPPQV